MAEINLNELSLDELKKLQKDVAKAIENFEERKRQETLAELEAIAKQKGFTLSELTGAQSRRKRKQAAPKYAHPQDPSRTWSGRGRRPRWVNEALESGKSLDDLAI